MQVLPTRLGHVLRYRLAEEEDPLGLQWELVDCNEVSGKPPMRNALLAQGLMHRQEFSREELDAFRIHELSYDSWIQLADGRVFRPIRPEHEEPPWLEGQKPDHVEWLQGCLPGAATGRGGGGGGGGAEGLSSCGEEDKTIATAQGERAGPTTDSTKSTRPRSIMSPSSDSEGSSQFSD
jgi:hypothetical protein